jgi:hypothetical protein
MEINEFKVKNYVAGNTKVKLTNQEIIKFAYITKDIIGYVWDKKLSNAQANCYVECFYTIQDLLEQLDKAYLVKHSGLCDFFHPGRRLTNDNEQLRWESYECGIA